VSTPGTDAYGQAVFDLLGLDATEDQADDIEREAALSNDRLGLFGETFPLVDGDGLADYLGNLHDAVVEVLNDRKALRNTLWRVQQALDEPSQSGDEGEVG
jgi:hypothetical protein